LADRELVERLAAALVPGAAGPDGTAAARERLLALSTGDAAWRLRAGVILLGAGAREAARQLVRQYVLGVGPSDDEAREWRTTVAGLCLALGDHAPLERFLRVCYQAEVTAELGEQPADGYFGAVEWVLRDGRSRFVFHPRIAKYAEVLVIGKHWAGVLPLLLAYARANPEAAGSVQLNLEDIGGRPGLTYSDHRGDFFLVPDPTFLGTDAYRETRRALDAAAPPWEQRRPVAYWRGATTGWVGCHGRPIGSWHELPRAVLCRVAREGPASAQFDVAISRIAQLAEPAASEVRQSGLTADVDPLERLTQYRFQIDIDGNTNAWKSLFVKLYSGNPVLKVQSAKGMRQWYYDRLEPWWNFVPVKPDMSDLHAVMRWLLDNQDTAREIGARGRAMVTEMTVEREIAAAFPTMAAAFLHAAYRREANATP
jgi:hypothetical protein